MSVPVKGLDHTWIRDGVYDLGERMGVDKVIRDFEHFGEHPSIIWPDDELFEFNAFNHPGFFPPFLEPRAIPALWLLPQEFKDLDS